jgi:hypothetical protein
MIFVLTPLRSSRIRGAVWRLVHAPVHEHFFGAACKHLIHFQRNDAPGCDSQELLSAGRVPTQLARHHCDARLTEDVRRMADIA